jgi:predicted dehydrogenase
MKSLTWGLVGCGDIAQRRVAPALKDLPDCRLHAVARSRSDLAESSAKEFGASKGYGTWENLLLDQEIEAVYIATPVYLHAQITIAAAEAGKHVLCEKPMAMNPTECDVMIAACKKHGVKLGIAYYRHFYPVVDRVKALMGSGNLGVIVYSQINAFDHFNPKPTEARYWLMEKNKSGGGPLFDFGCHRIEIFLNLLGRVKTVKGFCSNVLFVREVEDTCTAIFRFDSGAHGVLNITHAAIEPQDTLDLFGSQGSISIPVLNEGTVTIRTQKGQYVENHPPHTNPHEPLIDDFTHAVFEDREPKVDGATGREVNRLLMEIYRQT